MEYRRILVVEHDEYIQSTIQNSADKNKLQLVWASNPAEMSLHLQEDSGLGALLISEDMCDNEFAIIHDIKKYNPYIRIIVVAQTWHLDAVRKSMHRGIFDYVTYPIDRDLLMQVIDLAIEQSVSRMQAAQANQKLLSLQRDLAIAGEVQNYILPSDHAEFSGCRIYGRMIPTRTIGGDFFDYFQLDNRHIGLVIGDVSGKGIPAALFMAITRSLIKMTALQTTSPEACLSQVNRALCAENPSLMFATVFYATLDTHNFELFYCNAGHNLPYMIQSNGKITCLPGTGDMALGFDENTQYHRNHKQLEPGECLFLYTDGVTEAVDPADQMFGNVRLVQIFSEIDHLDPERLVQKVLSGLMAYSSGAAQTDDITMLALSTADQRITTEQNIKEKLSFVIQNDIAQLPALHQNIVRFCTENEFTFEIRHALEISVEELFTNIINYAYPENGRHQIYFELSRSADAIRMEIRDDGQPFNPAQIKNRSKEKALEKSRIGGWGLQIVRKFMDDVHYHRDNNLNILTLTKNISVSPKGERHENSAGKNKTGSADPITGTL